MPKYPILSLVGAPTDGRNEIQRVTGGGVISGGTWDISTLDGNAETTNTVTGIPWDVTAAELQVLIDDRAEPDIIVTGGPVASAPFEFEFTRELGGLDRAQLTVSAVGLVGQGHALVPSSPTGGIRGSFRGAGYMTPLEDTTNGNLYVNGSSSPWIPEWVIAPILEPTRVLTPPAVTPYVDVFHWPPMSGHPGVFEPITT